jgi:hypothetical protein
MVSTFQTLMRTCPVNSLPCGCAPAEACRWASATQYDTGPAPADEKRCADCKASRCAGPDNCRNEWDKQRADDVKRCGACDRSPCQCKVPARDPLLPRNAVLRIQAVGNGFIVEAPNYNGEPLVFQTLGKYENAFSLAEFVLSHFDAPEDR